MPRYLPDEGRNCYFMSSEQCLEEAMAPIYRCPEDHIICSVCEPRVERCPVCRTKYRGRSSRHRFAESTAEELEELRVRLQKELEADGIVG